MFETAIYQIRRHCRLAAALSLVLATVSSARCDDAPSPIRSPSNAIGGGQQDENIQIAQAGQGVPAAPAAPVPPDNSAAAAREESAPSIASSSTPNMIGDMGVGHFLTIMVAEVSDLGAPVNLAIPTPSAGILGRQRIADNDCVLPTDRVFCDYSYFHDAYATSPTDAHRFVPGFEKTFFDGRASVEVRLPVGILTSNNIVANNADFGSTGQFGDIQVITKAILHQEETWTLAGGMGISLPTAPSLNIRTAGGTPLIGITNASTHLLPFVGLLVKPNDDWFIQSFVQLDFAANGDPVATNPNGGTTLTPSGTIYDQTMIFVDASVGHWLYRNPSQRFSGLAAVIEAHYTGGLNAPSTLQPFGSSVGNSVGYSTAEYNVLDLTVGAHAVVGDTTYTLGFATPVTNDRGFDGELRFFVNRRF